MRKHNPMTELAVKSLYSKAKLITDNGSAISTECHELYTTSLNSFSTGYSVIERMQKNTEYHESEKHEVLEAMSLILLTIAGSYYKTKAVIDTNELIKINVDISNPIRLLESLHDSLEPFIKDASNKKELNHKMDIFFMSLMEISKDKGNLNRFYKEHDLEYEFDDCRVKGNLVLEKSENKIVSKKVYWHQMIGNEALKSNAIKSMYSLFCYDFQRARNPAYDLFGMPAITMAHGGTGTGKSMEGSCLATMGMELSDELGIPFKNNEVPGNFVSKYQGESGDKHDAVWDAMDQRTYLMLSLFDECDNYYKSRDMNPSEGSEAVTNSFLRKTEGSYAGILDRGNNIIRLYTNRPDVIDNPVKSRIQFSVEATGPTSSDEFMALDKITLIKYIDKLAPGFNNLDQLEAENTVYVPPAQTVQASDFVSEIVSGIKFDKVTMNFYAELNIAFKKTYSHFAPRDVRNIHNQVKARMGNFEFPVEWFKAGNEHMFIGLNYDGRFKKIQQLIVDSMEGQKLSDVLYDVTIDYLTNFVKTN